MGIGGGVPLALVPIFSAFRATANRFTAPPTTYSALLQGEFGDAAPVETRRRTLQQRCRCYSSAYSAVVSVGQRQQYAIMILFIVHCLFLVLYD